ncbi:MAG: hypothetical protein JJ975_06625, partial [Bacteroidia bacterium]|nr:hypothetical protein [Bacteroidia bacterium]
VFLIPIGLYFWAFSQHYDLELFAKRLFTESSSRTVADKSLLQSIGHLFSFPFIYLMDIMPWGLSVLVFFRKDARQLVWSSSFLRSCIWLFGANIIVYWLSPDYRARYVFMLTPFLLIPSLYALYRTVNASVRIKKMGIWIPGIAFLVALIFGMVVSSKISFPFSELFVGLICMALILFVTDVLKVEFQYPLTYSLLIILVVIRIAYTNSVVPIRIETGPYLTEKTEGLEIARLSKYDQLAMYHSNISLTMNWYITTARNQTLETETSNHNLSSMYLVPTEVIKDTSNVDTYFNFVRRYEQKPFSLVKFKRSFPAMPKKKE